MIFVEIINSIFTDTELEEGNIYVARTNERFWTIDIILQSGEVIKNVSTFNIRRLSTKESRKYKIEQLMNRLL